MAKKIQGWEKGMIWDDYNFYVREKALARNSLSKTEDISAQKRKFSAVIYGDYYRAFIQLMLKNKKIPEYADYRRHWLLANKETWAGYSAIEVMCSEYKTENISHPMINKGYSHVGQMWGLATSSY